jgi:cytochrome c oxidase subunit I
MATRALSPAAVASYRGGLYEWLTTTDHKKIGIMYVINSFLFFLIGGIFALLVRTELAVPGIQLFTNEHVYNEAFSIHATVMIFLFIIPMLAGLGNYVVPLMVGAPDMAFPRINALSFWMLPLGGILLLSGFLTPGGAAAAGWTSYPPLTERGPLSSPGPGQDLWIVALILIGTSSILGGINFLVTIFKMRAPGMTLFRMPIMVWTILVTSVLVVMATPVITSALVMLFIDRNYGGTFFLPPEGQAVLYQNVFWFYSHPAVYVMVLPAMGVISEVLPVFSRKPLFGYKAFIFATAAIGALGFSVWAHHMFTTGAVFLPFFSLMTFLIAVPTGVKMFNWIATMWRGTVEFRTALLFAAGFLGTFLIGGITGIFLAVFPVDWQLTDTYFVVAHLHYVLVGGAVFAIFAGIYYWFPKITGRMLSEGLGKLSFWLILIGFHVTFLIQHSLGLDGMPRRVYEYPDVGHLELYNLISTIGSFILAAGILVTVVNVVRSVKVGVIAGPDPWKANTLEWFTTSPPPVNNFDIVPRVRSVEPMKDIRRQVERQTGRATASAQPAPESALQA